MIDLKEKIPPLKDYFARIPQVAMAFIFGSAARGQAGKDSDFDLAVYFAPQGKAIEWEDDRRDPLEDAMWLDVEKIVGRDVDLVVLNRAPSPLVFQILRSGIPILENEALRTGLMLRVHFEAIDFMAMLDDWYAIKARSASLNEIDRQRLLRLIDFLEKETADKSHFAALTWQVYQNDSDKRRNVERWVENMVNCSIDMAKIMLASERKTVPETYKQTLAELSLLAGFDETTAGRLAGFAKLRNILAHEYLDIRFHQIENFLREFEEPFRSLILFTGKFSAR